MAEKPSVATQDPAADTQPAPTSPETPSTEDREALQYWGYLVKPDKCGTELLNRLLAGIAHYIATTFEPDDCSDLTPAQLAAFYRTVGGNYDILFVDTPLSSIAFIYKSLGCLHSIQPDKDNDGYKPPVVPSLKPKGFITWQTIQLLLGPEEHVPFLQNAVKQFDIIDPKTGQAFPKILPKEAFPDKPNQEMLDWYEEVSDRLKKEPEPGLSEESGRTSLSTNEYSGGESGDERQAAKYFSNPLYRDRGGRPQIVRRVSRQPKPSPRQVIEDRGRAVMHSVRHFWNPQVRPRRRSLPEKEADEDYLDEDYEDVTPTGLHPRYAPRRPVHHRARSSRSDSDNEEPVLVELPKHRSHSRQTSKSPRRESPGSRQTSRRPSPVLRHHRSDELPQSPSDYFPRYHENDRRSSTYSAEPVGGFAPSKAPLFAAQVAQLQAKRPSPRPTSEERGSYNGRPTVRYSRHSIEPIEERPGYARSKRSNDRDDYARRSQSYDREPERPRTRGGRYVQGTGGRRYPLESPWN